MISYALAVACVRGADLLLQLAARFAVHALERVEITEIP